MSDAKTMHVRTLVGITVGCSVVVAALLVDLPSKQEEPIPVIHVEPQPVLVTEPKPEPKMEPEPIEPPPQPTQVGQDPIVLRLTEEPIREELDEIIAGLKKTAATQQKILDMLSAQDKVLQKLANPPTPVVVAPKPEKKEKKPPLVVAPKPEKKEEPTVVVSAPKPPKRKPVLKEPSQSSEGFKVKLKSGRRLPEMTPN